MNGVEGERVGPPRDLKQTLFQVYTVSQAETRRKFEAYRNFDIRPSIACDRVVFPIFKLKFTRPTSLPTS